LDRDSLVYSSLNYKASEDSNKHINTGNILMFLLFATIFNFKALLLLPVNVGFYYYMKWVNQKDPWKKDSYKLYLKHSDFYDPWISEKLKSYGERPYGLGKGVRV